ncbi:MAG TPA: divalent-cation tolerance protein CutA [Anaerolineae bacterium]|nr:divalent-cation tolerance protein CutA [Anaerolineae bacterium]
MGTNQVVALITAPSREVGERIAQALVEGTLAACVNIVAPIRSVYTWEGKTCREEEVLLVAKTTLAVFQGPFVPAVKALHPYDVTEIIALPIVAGAGDYLQWIERATQA